MFLFAAAIDGCALAPARSLDPSRLNKLTTKLLGVRRKRKKGIERG
jgi:hypothetical protein